MKIGTVKMSGTILFKIVIASVFFGIAAIFPQDIKMSLFKEANDNLRAVKNAQGDVLAPDNFSKGMKFYREAEEDYSKGKKLDDIRKKLRGAVAYFKKAEQAVKLAEVTFVSTIKSRSSAIDAEASRYAKDLWTKAEVKFSEAAKKLEDGNVKSARGRATEAEKLYREAELNAIKTNYLKETWDLLAKAEQLDVKKRAPKTLGNAQKLIKDAEKELNDNRYDTDVARSLAQQAKYEAKHALYLNRVIDNMKEKRISSEDLILEWQQPLQDIAANMDLVAEFDAGYQNITNKIILNTRAYQDSLSSLGTTLSDREQDIVNLEARIGELQTRIGDLESSLGTAAQEQSELQRRMEDQAKVRQQFKTVEKMFDREEARVFREGNDVIIRLVGLNFASGKSTIEAANFALLTKVQKAIRTFPDCRLNVEGHTDSHGGDELNLKLSQERADAVVQYLLANMGELGQDKVVAQGYGESQPIANNETADGRKKNRRIDIVIRPGLLFSGE